VTQEVLFGPRISAQERFSKVLLADVHDTAFSGDPFPIVSTTNGLYALGEDTMIGACDVTHSYVGHDSFICVT